MAEMYAVSREQLTAIADAIRQKRDIATPIEVADMAMQIGLIDGGGSHVQIDIGEFIPTADSGSNPVIIPHSLGAVPDIVILVYTGSSPTDKSTVRATARIHQYAVGANYVQATATSSNIVTSSGISNVTEDSFTFTRPHAYAGLIKDYPYQYVCIKFKED